VARGVAMPDEAALPPGPRRDLTTEIHVLYRGAGKPSLREISTAIRRNDDLLATVSHEKVRDILWGKQTSRRMVECLARQLIEWPGTTLDLDADATVRRIQKLWDIAEGSDEPAGSAPASAIGRPNTAPAPPSRPEPLIRPADPGLLRLAVRNLYRPTPDSAIALFLVSVLYVPHTSGGGFIIAATQRSGPWLCAFTSIDRLLSHQRTVQSPWAGDWVELGGRDLVRQVCELPLPIGIIVDPPDASDGDVTETLPLAHHVLKEISDGWGSARQQ
jgi:hypothetical protein